VTVRSLKGQLASLRDELGMLQPAERDRAKYDDLVRRMEALVEEVPPEISVEEPVSKKKYSILDWWGVGKEFWSQIDVDEYIRKERDSWR
jgi:hypothetical protein